MPYNDMMYTACGYGMQPWVQCLLGIRQTCAEAGSQEIGTMHRGANAMSRTYETPCEKVMVQISCEPQKKQEHGCLEDLSSMRSQGTAIFLLCEFVGKQLKVSR